MPRDGKSINGYTADIGSDKKMKKADILVSAGPFLPETVIRLSNVQVLLIENTGCASVPFEVGFEMV